MTSVVAELDIHSSLDFPELRGLVRPERLLWKPRELRELTSRLVCEYHRPLSGLLRYVPQRRWWARLALTRGVELWLLSWLPGQGTEPHDHGGASGSFSVLAGTLTEAYRYPGSSIRTSTRAAGATVCFGVGRAHEVRNAGDGPAASVHAYSPPLVPTREYASLRDIPADIPPLPATRLPFAELRKLAEVEGP